MILRFLIEKEFKQIVRNPFLPKVILVFPVIMLLIMPWASDQEIRNLRVTVVNNSHTPSSSQLINRIEASKYFTITAIATSIEQAYNYIESNETDIILTINRKNSDYDTYHIAANAVNGMKGGLAVQYLTGCMAGAQPSRSAVSAQTTSIRMEAVRLNTELRATHLFNPHLDYKVFMLPALMVMLLTMLTGFLPALNIVSEKEAGTMEQINVTPVSKHIFIIGKLIPYWCIGFVVLTISLVIAALVYNLVPVGSLLTIYMFVGVYVLAVSGLGLLISNYSNTMQQAMFLMFFFIMILLLLSGLFTPIGSMPEWAKWLAAVNPLKYFMEVMRAVYLKGSTVAHLIPQLCTLLAFAIVLNAWAIISYRKKQ